MSPAIYSEGYIVWSATIKEGQVLEDVGDVMSLLHVKPQRANRPALATPSSDDQPQTGTERPISVRSPQPPFLLFDSSSSPKIKLRRESEYPRLDLILEQKQGRISTSCMQRPDLPAVGSVIRRI